MLRLSRLADYAVVVLLRMGADTSVRTATGLASATGIPEPTVAKVLKMAAASRLAVSSRGARGGYRLARPLDQISIAAVIAAIDGPIAVTACVEGAVTECEVRRVCALRGRWAPVNDAVQRTLDAISLADLLQMPAEATPLMVPPDRPEARPHGPAAARAD
jgi:FeS assembly SUF system regulator